MDSKKFHAIMNGRCIDQSGEVVLTQTEENRLQTKTLSRLFHCQSLRDDETKHKRIKIVSSQAISVF